MNEREAVTWIAEVFEEPPDRITALTLRKDIIGWDSLGTLVLIAALDERVNVHLTEKDINGMQGVADILAILRRNGKLDD